MKNNQPFPGGQSDTSHASANSRIPERISVQLKAPYPRSSVGYAPERRTQYLDVPYTCTPFARASPISSDSLRSLLTVKKACNPASLDSASAKLPKCKETASKNAFRFSSYFFRIFCRCLYQYPSPTYNAKVNWSSSGCRLIIFGNCRVKGREHIVRQYQIADVRNRQQSLGY